MCIFRKRAITLSFTNVTLKGWSEQTRIVQPKLAQLQFSICYVIYSSALQTQYSKFEPWRCEADHATGGSPQKCIFTSERKKNEYQSGGRDLRLSKQAALTTANLSVYCCLYVHVANNSDQSDFWWLNLHDNQSDMMLFLFLFTDGHSVLWTKCNISIDKLIRVISWSFSIILLLLKIVVDVTENLTVWYFNSDYCWFCMVMCAAAYKQSYRLSVISILYFSFYLVLSEDGLYGMTYTVWVKTSLSGSMYRCYWQYVISMSAFVFSTWSCVQTAKDMAKITHISNFLFQSKCFWRVLSIDSDSTASCSSDWFYLYILIGSIYIFLYSVSADSGSTACCIWLVVYRFWQCSLLLPSGSFWILIAVLQPVAFGWFCLHILTEKPVASGWLCLQIQPAACFCL